MPAMSDSPSQILITDDVHPHLIEGLEKLGYICHHRPHITLEETRQIIEAYCGVVINSKILADHRLMDRATNLDFIARLGSGLDIIDLELANAKEIAVLSAPEGNCNAVGEHALAMLLNLCNKINQGDRQVRDFVWQREANRGMELDGKTVGIIGFGHTGPAFARKLQGFEVKILVCDPKCSESDVKKSHAHAKLVDLAGLQANADVVSLHVDLNPSTKHLIDQHFIVSMPRPFYLINTSRGSVVNTADLLVGLKSGKIKGAALDVFENEKTATFSPDEKALYS